MRKIIIICFLIVVQSFSTENHVLALKKALESTEIQHCASILFHMNDPIEFMKQNGDVLVYLATLRDCPDILALFLGYKAPLYYVDPQNYTALMRAASQDHIDCMKLLLEHGAEVNFQTKEGSALYIAADWDKCAATDLLLLYGADMHLPKNDGTTPFKVANSTFERQNLLPIFYKHAKRLREINTKILQIKTMYDSTLKSIVVNELLKKNNDNYCQLALLIAALVGDRNEGMNHMSYITKLTPALAHQEAVSYIYDFCFTKPSENGKN